MPPHRSHSLRLSAFAALICLAVASVVRADPLWTEEPSQKPSVAAQTLPDFVDLAARLSPAVVNISTEQAEEDKPEAKGKEERGPAEGPEELPENLLPNRSLGSGFIINREGYLLTNAHVVENATTIRVSLQDGREFIARVVGKDAKSDVALLKIDSSEALPIAPLGDSDRLRVGEWVMAIGNPFGFDHSVTAGIVSAKNRFIPGNYDDFIQTDASINPGNSGGPLIDLHGDVIGINSAIYTRTGSSMGIGFAVPVNLVKDELNQLKSRGKVIRGWLGVYVRKLDPARDRIFKGRQGALVEKVIAGGPAQAAGIKPGDLIIAFDGRPVPDAPQLPLLVGSVPVGHTATIEVLRDGTVKRIAVTITTSHEEELAKGEELLRAPTSSASLGLRVRDFNGTQAGSSRGDRVAGVMIEEVERGSAAQTAGLRKDDVIVEVNRKPVTDVASYRKVLANAASGKSLLFLVRRDEGSVYIAVVPAG